MLVKQIHCDGICKDQLTFCDLIFLQSGLLLQFTGIHVNGMTDFLQGSRYLLGSQLYEEVLSLLQLHIIHP